MHKIILNCGLQIHTRERNKPTIVQQKITSFSERFSLLPNITPLWCWKTLNILLLCFLLHWPGLTISGSQTADGGKPKKEKLPDVWRNSGWRLQPPKVGIDITLNHYLKSFSSNTFQQSPITTISRKIWISRKSLPLCFLDFFQGTFSGFVELFTLNTLTSTRYY